MSCAVRTCGRPVPLTHLMCRSHWKMVPRPLQARVWATYRARQTAQATFEYISMDDKDSHRAAVERLSATRAAHAEAARAAREVVEAAA